MTYFKVKSVAYRYELEPKSRRTSPYVLYENELLTLNEWAFIKRNFVYAKLVLDAEGDFWELNDIIDATPIFLSSNLAVTVPVKHDKRNRTHRFKTLSSIKSESGYPIFKHRPVEDVVAKRFKQEYYIHNDYAGEVFTELVALAIPYSYSYYTGLLYVDACPIEQDIVVSIITDKSKKSHKRG